MVRVLGVIPARLGSTRLPRKMLRLVAGVPLVVRVYRAARGCSLLDDLVVATDSPDIAHVCHQFDVPVVMTAPDHPSGTDRVWEVAQRIRADLYVNIQGDEPLVTPEHLECMLRPLLHSADISVSTLCFPIDAEQARCPDIVKVVRDRRGRAVYFSRSPIPFPRDPAAVTYLKHLGFYTYTRDALETFHQLPVGQLEQAEKLEQLRLLEHGIQILVADAPADTLGVDTEDDLMAVERALLENAGPYGAAA